MINDRQMTRYQMLLSVQSFLNQHQAVWSGVPILAQVKTSLDDLVLGVHENLKTAGKDVKGLTTQKNQLKEHLAEKTAVLSGALAAYAALSNQPNLEAQATIHKSDIARAKDAELPPKIQDFIELLLANMEHMADYGITEPQVNDLMTSLDDFRELIGQPRLKRSEALSAKKEASTLIDEGLELLNNSLDRIMIRFKFSDANFYDSYTRARVIVD